MDDRKRIIRELEDKKRSEAEACNRLYEGLGETLLQRIGEGEFLSEITARELAADYHKLQKEIAESAGIIKGLEADMLKHKELEARILVKEEEQSRLEKELGEVHTLLGKLLLTSRDSDEFADFYRQQEEPLLAKINEQEQKVRELEEREGGVFSWLGKNAQIALSRALLSKNRSGLQKVYRTAGEQFLSAGPADALDGEAAGAAAEAAAKAQELKKSVSDLTVELSSLKGERRNLGSFINADGSPSQRIQTLEKHIVHVRGELPDVYRRFGSLAAEADGREAVSSFLGEDDLAVLARAEILKLRVAELELDIEKTRAAISIDSEKAEIEKMKRAIANQQQKISDANSAISDLEKKIAESEERIVELKAFISASK